MWPQAELRLRGGRRATGGRLAASRNWPPPRWPRPRAPLPLPGFRLIQQRVTQMWPQARHPSDAGEDSPRCCHVHGRHGDKKVAGPGPPRGSAGQPAGLCWAPSHGWGLGTPRGCHPTSTRVSSSEGPEAAGGAGEARCAGSAPGPPCCGLQDARLHLAHKAARGGEELGAGGEDAGGEQDSVAQQSVRTQRVKLVVNTLPAWPGPGRGAHGCGWGDPLGLRQGPGAKSGGSSSLRELRGWGTRRGSPGPSPSPTLAQGVSVPLRGTLILRPP